MVCDRGPCIGNPGFLWCVVMVYVCARVSVLCVCVCVCVLCVCVVCVCMCVYVCERRCVHHCVSVMQIPVRPFVEVTFEGAVERTATTTGVNPFWNEELVLPLV